ncbi:MAG: lipopolysaccharide transport periplasmic protein LptA [Hydrocarboniphaga effusa]|nr:lipopolysaccharide transport periplasmic protein LptA [Hydrocarboniphaga effusa]
MCCVCCAAQAETGGAFALPKGPIKVTSQRADIDEQGKLMLYRGNVRLVSGTLELKGERLELRQPAPGQFEALLLGKPARLVQQGQNHAPSVSASATEIVYSTRAATLDLSGDATLSRGEDVLTGDRIRYDLASRRISASGTDGEQIKFVIQPPEDKKAPLDAKPAAPEKPIQDHGGQPPADVPLPAQRGEGRASGGVREEAARERAASPAAQGQAP